MSASSTKFPFYDSDIFQQSGRLVMPFKGSFDHSSEYQNIFLLFYPND